MGLFDVFKKKVDSDNDPYWEFDLSTHFRPRINKGDFFRLSGFDFGWLVVEPMSKHLEQAGPELKTGKCFTYSQKALFYWWYVDAQVTNGGFIQYYYNDYAHYTPTVIKSLEYVGDKRMAELVRSAHGTYLKNQEIFERARKSALSESGLYDRLKKMSRLDETYYSLHKGTMANIERHFRAHMSEICVDEDGAELDPNFSGECKSHYANGQIKETFTIKNGKSTREHDSFHENGRKKSSTRVTPNGDALLEIQYYENGNPKESAHKRLANDEKFGEYKRWHENGQLAETANYTSNTERIGAWLRWYPNGQMHTEAEFTGGELRLKNCWTEKGEHILKDGTGLYVHEYACWEGSRMRYEEEYKNYKRHGKQYTYNDGVLSLYQEMRDGKSHGITRSYDEQGNAKQESLYENDKEVSRTVFPLPVNPALKAKA